MQSSHSSNLNSSAQPPPQNNEASDNPVDSRDSPEDIKPAQLIQPTVSVSLQRPQDSLAQPNKSVSQNTKQDAENFQQEDTNKFGAVSLKPSSEMPSLSKTPALQEPMVAPLSHSPVDLSGTGTAYGQSLRHSSVPNFESQKASVYSSGNIQIKHQDLMPPESASDIQIGVQHSKQLQTHLSMSKSPSLAKQGFSTQQVQVSRQFMAKTGDSLVEPKPQRQPSLQCANRHNLFGGNNKLKSSSASSIKSDYSSEQDAYLRKPIIQDQLNKTMPNRSSQQPNYTIVPKNSLTWRDSYSGQQDNDPQDQISSSKTISVSEVDEEDMRILSNALKKEQGSKGSEEMEEEKHPSLSPVIGSQKPRQNFEQRIQAIRKLQREDPNIYKEWSPRRKEDRANRGNWSKSEDEQLIQAVSKYGERDWKMISEYVNERTPQQCRQRWFEALNPDLVKGKWTHQEDQKLLKAVRKHDGNWQRIAEVVKSRTNKQCLQRWHEVLKPDLIKGTWTSAEDQQLTNAVIQYGSRNWQKIAEHVEGRTNKQCLQRWKVALRTELARDNWTKEDDEQLTYSVTKYGEDWPKIAKRMNRKSQSGRSLIQCLHRWKTVHNPSFDGSSKGKWTLQEDEQLVIAMSMWNGKNWSYIAQSVDGRDENECFSRWYEKIKPAISRMSWDEPNDLLLDQLVLKHEVGNWNSIAEGIEKHTPQQCMLRYYEKLNPDLGKGSKGAWTFDEDEKLRKAVEIYNAKDWKKIAQCVEGRSIQQCHQRWHGKLNPTVTKGQWTEEEDQKLCMAVSKYGDRDWKKVSECVPGRSKKLCHQRWEIILNPDIVKGHWTHEEDNKLTIAVQKFGEGNWNRIAEFVEGRTNKQCRYRWHDVVYLRLSRGGRTNWTKQEDERLIASVEKFGKGNWMKIAQNIEGRTNKQCLYRWRQIENRSVAERDKLNSHWTTKQDEKLIYLVKKLGAQKWTQIADHFPGKKGKSCRERWHNHLDPSIKKSSWTLEEELVLYLQNREQKNKWAEISKVLKGRTDNTIKNHWNSIMKTKSSEMLTETEKRFKQYCTDKKFDFVGLPIGQSGEFTQEYKETFAQFEKSLLKELIDIVEMQNVVYYQMKSQEKGGYQHEQSFDEIDRMNSELSRQQRNLYNTQTFNQPSSLSDSRSQLVTSSVASSMQEKQLDTPSNTVRIPVSSQKMAKKSLKIDDQQEKMVADIKFGLEQDKSQNNMLNLQVHVPPNPDHQTLNFSFYEESQKGDEQGDQELKPAPSGSQSNIKIELMKRKSWQQQTGK